MKHNTTPVASASREKLMECAMQIVHGGLLDPNSKLPTVESVADVIERSLDFAWLCSIRDRAESVPSQQSSASRHTPEPWYQREGRIYAMVEDDEILIADTAPDNVGLTEYDEANAEHICQLHNAVTNEQEQLNSGDLMRAMLRDGNGA